MKISILIPVNDFDLVALVRSMRGGIDKVREFCEIIIGDDGSSEEFRKMYLSLEDDKVKVIVSEKNIGRAAIRNRLITESTGDFLLFLDADAMIPGTAEAFLLKWLTYIKYSRVICGGILYSNTPPGDPDKILRWRYGRKKDQKKATERNKHPYTSFSTFNVLIDKAIFSRLRFYEELKKYGFEDILFGYQLKKAGIDVMHIDNGLVHEGLETNKEFLTKTKFSIENLSRLYDNVTDKRTFTSVVGLLQGYRWLRFFHLTRILAGLFIRYRDWMEIKLDSAKISLALFRFYKISMFSTYREIHRRRKILPMFNIPPDAI
jgi:glycosyltransferase involved in cell wall biosynthesis